MKQLKIFSLFTLLFITIGCKQLDAVYFPDVKITKVQGIVYDDLVESVEIDEGEDLKAEVTFSCEVGFSYAELYLSNGTEVTEYLNGLDKKGEKNGFFNLTIPSDQVQFLINNSVSITPQSWVKIFVFDVEGNVGEGYMQFKLKS